MAESAHSPDNDRIDYTYRLLYCASKGDTIGLKQVLREGTSPDAADYDSRTALHLAASEGHLPIVELLLDYKASINPVDRWGRRPLSDARKYGFNEICRILEESGGTEEEDLTSRNEYSELDPLIGKHFNTDVFGKRRNGHVDYTYNLLYCASKGDVVGLNQVLKEGASPDAADYDQRTALHLAASEGHAQIVELLLEYKASVNPVDRWGRTPLSDARRYGFKEICRTLEANGATEVEIPSCPPVEDCEVDPSELDVDKGTLIGQGAFGEVRLVTWRGTRVAVKTLKSPLNSDPIIRKEFLKELAIWKHLRHPNIVQFLGAITRGDQLAIVTEYLPKGNLRNILLRNGRIDAMSAVKFALDVARGMNYLHEHKPDPLVHRDLAPRNLLMDEAGHLKVADFGLSKLLEASSRNIFETYKMTGTTGTYRYMAPEVYRAEPYDKSVDVFSFGIIVAEMFEGGPSCGSEQPEWIADKRAHDNLRPPLTAHTYPLGLKEVLKSCWDDNPVKRPTFARIITCLEDMEQDLAKSNSSILACNCIIC